MWENEMRPVFSLRASFIKNMPNADFVLMTKAKHVIYGKLIFDDKTSWSKLIIIRYLYITLKIGTLKCFFYQVFTWIK